MKIINKNLREGIINILVNNEEDLWYLSQIVIEGDVIRGKCTRKIRIGDKEKATKKTFTASIKVTEVSYEVNSLRFNGTLEHELDETPIGSHQAISLEVGDNVKITKNWSKLDLQKLEEAEKEHFDFLLGVIDRDEATIAILKKRGYEILTQLKGERKGKQYEGEVKDFFKDVVEKLKQYVARYESKKLIIGCSTFWNDGLKKHLGDLSKKTIFVPYSNSGTKKDVEHLLQQKELSHILESDRTAHEVNLVEEAMVRISKLDKVAYGFEEVSKLADMGAIDKLLISEKLIKEAQKKGEFRKVDKLMKATENTSGEIYIIKSNHDAGKKLYSLGGVVGMLRY